MHWNRLIVVSALFLFPDCVLTASGTETSPTNAILDQSSDVFALIHPERVKARVTACVCPPAAGDEIPATALANFERFDPLEMTGVFSYFTHRFPGMDNPVHVCLFDSWRSGSSFLGCTVSNDVPRAVGCAIQDCSWWEWYRLGRTNGETNWLSSPCRLAETEATTPAMATRGSWPFSRTRTEAFGKTIPFRESPNWSRTHRFPVWKGHGGTSQSGRRMENGLPGPYRTRGIVSRFRLAPRFRTRNGSPRWRPFSTTGRTPRPWRRPTSCSRRIRDEIRSSLWFRTERTRRRTDACGFRFCGMERNGRRPRRTDSSARPGAARRRSGRRPTSSTA